MNQDELALKLFEERARKLDSADRWHVMVLVDRIRKDLRFLTNNFSFKSVKREVES